MGVRFRKFLRASIDPYGFVGVYDPLFGELISTVICVVWGGWFLLPITQIFAHGAPFEFFAPYLSDFSYGAHFLFFGILQFIGYRFNNYILRILSNIAITAGWAFTTIGLILGSFYISSTLPLSVCIFFGELFLFIGMVRRHINKIRVKR